MKDLKKRKENILEFGLSTKAIEKLRNVFAKSESIELVILYGSRAKGNYKNHSDIDLAILNTISYDELLRVETQIDDLLLPQEADLIRFDSIENVALKEHIERRGKVFYKR
jgi:predicted nucleotidyltransferase